jgi:hypothetical protein
MSGKRENVDWREATHSQMLLSHNETYAGGLEEMTVEVHVENKVMNSLKSLKFSNTCKLEIYFVTN